MSDVSDVISKLDRLLGNANNDRLYGRKVVTDNDLMERMFRFITSLEPKQLEDQQIETVMGIVDDVEFLEEEE